MTRTNWITWLAAASSLLALGASQSGCTSTECGTGTIDKAGQCVPATDATGNASCGAGTVLSKTTGKCEPTMIVQCDPGSTTPEEDPQTHVITCVGTGTTGCQATISCPTATTGKMTICGEFLDAETSMPIAASNPTGKACDPNNPTPDGPCAIQIRPYDAIAFASDPTTAPVLPTDEIVINDCGQFRIKNIQPQGAQYIGIGVENNDKVGTKTLRRTGVALPTAVGKAVAGFPGYAVRISTDAHWTQTAGLTGPTFVDRGVYMGIFLHGQTPVAGVKITRGGSTDSANDYYFSDSAPNMRFTIDPAQTATGADGSGLMLGANGSLTQYSGTGGETTTCKWPSDLGDQITNVAFIQPRIEVQTANPTMICP